MLLHDPSKRAFARGPDEACLCSNLRAYLADARRFWPLFTALVLVTYLYTTNNHNTYYYTDSTGQQPQQQYNLFRRTTHQQQPQPSTEQANTQHAVTKRTTPPRYRRKTTQAQFTATAHAAKELILTCASCRAQQHACWNEDYHGFPHRDDSGEQQRKCGFKGEGPISRFQNHINTVLAGADEALLIDVGANLDSLLDGSITWTMADPTNTDVVLIEPLPANVEALERSMQVKGKAYRSVKILRNAVFSERKEMTFNTGIGQMKGRAGDPHGALVQPGDTRASSTIDVTAITLDGDVLPSFKSMLQSGRAVRGYLKVDTEGFDVHALLGAVELLSMLDVVTFECSGSNVNGVLFDRSGAGLQAGVDLLDALGYDAFMVGHAVLLRLNGAGMFAPEYGRGGWQNCAAVRRNGPKYDDIVHDWLLPECAECSRLH